MPSIDPPGVGAPEDHRRGDFDAPPPSATSWIALCPAPISAEDVHAWLIEPDCGAVVVFAGTARDHSPGRSGVTALEYEAYEGPAVSRMHEIVEQTRARWPEARRVAVLHRVGLVPAGSPAVLVGLASPHRDAAFEAARHLIDTVKATVPLWKKEHWPGGEAWAEPCHQVGTSA